MTNALERMIAARKIEAMRGDSQPPPSIQAVPVQSAAQRVAKALGLTLEELKAEADASPGPDERQARYVEVPDTKELRRILSIERRPLDSGAEIAEQITDAFRTPWGKQKLRPLQGLALHDLILNRGLFAPLRVGSGKTLLSYLAPAVLEAKRPLLLVPAKLKRKTRDEFKHLSKDWLGPHPDLYRIESYEILGRPQAGNQLDEKGNLKRPGYLEKWRPDLIVMDEVHCVKNPRAAVTKRLKRYLKANPGVAVVAMSGTVTRKSLKDYSHILGWCLPNGAPLPQVWSDLEAWASALDQKVIGIRTKPGALKLLLPPTQTPLRPGTEEELNAIRLAYRDRLVESPGVVATQGGELGTSLVISTWEPESYDSVLEQHFTTLRTCGETPDGQPIADFKDLARHAKTLALGLYYRWNPRPPQEWLDARSAWAKWCREVLKHNRKGLDSEGQVVQAVRQGIYNDQGLYAAWIEQRDIERKLTGHNEPPTEGVWLSEEALQACVKWADKNPGIIWVEHVQFGRKLSEVSGLPYYQRNGLSADGKYIEHHPHNTPMIASISSNATGRNLQFGWAHNLVTCPPSSGLTWEQLIGRTHREGQEADEVSVDIYLGAAESVASFEEARRDAQYRQDTTGAVDKLNYGTIDVPSLDEVASRGGYRWDKGV